KGVVARRGETALALARRFPPDAITLDLRLPDTDGWEVLDQFKNDLTTRHIPVHIISVEDGWQRGLKLGAFAYLKKPVSKQALAEAFARMQSFVERRVKNLLVVEADVVQRRSSVELMGGGDGQVTAADT